jgi:hypothetical protein
MKLNTLAAAIASLSPEQQNKEAVITDGNDCNGNANYFRAEALLASSNLSINGVKDTLGDQFVIVVEDMTENVDSAPQPVNTDEGFDEFLQDATLALREMWEGRSGEEIGEHEAQHLNDLLNHWFSDKL